MAPSSPVVAKIKVQLKLAISRLRMTQQKDTAIAKQQRRAMALLLEQSKEESARIRVENIIRSDITTELHEILELYCELLLARIGLLEAKECDPGLEEAVKSVIYAAPRTDIKELQQTRQLLIDKYGKEFALQAVENSDGKVADRVLHKLRVEPPAQELVTLYLSEIARTYGVDWPKGRLGAESGSEEADAGQTSQADDGGDGDGDDDGGGGGGQLSNDLEEPLTTAELSRATPPRALAPKSPVAIAPPKGSTDNVRPKINFPQQPEDSTSKDAADSEKNTRSSDAAAASPKARAGAKAATRQGSLGGRIPDVDELAARFAALRK